MQSHIYVYGDIWHDQSEYASEYGVVSLRNVVEQMQASANADELIVHIHSRGGDVTEGFAIHDALLNSGKKITTINDGLCASIATVIFLAGTTRKAISNGEFMIHNPWGYGPFKGGDAAAFASYSEDLQKAEDKIIQLYANVTGQGEDSLREMMKVQTYMSSEEAKNVGFVTEIIEALKAVAYLKPLKTNSKKQEPTMANKLLEKLNTLMTDIKGLLTGTEALNLDLTTADGKVFHIETENDFPAVGDMCTIDGASPADGDYTLSDGTVIAVSAGKITAITPKVEDAAPAPAADAAAIAAIKKENEELRAQIAEQETTMAAIETQLTEFKAQVKSTYKPEARKSNFQKKEKEVENDPFKAASERRKAEAEAKKNKK
jgi:ATP-dependent Clp endopeptidase proteolytic subunit ClpP